VPTFKPPYGPKDPAKHVTNPAQHFGYRYIVAALVDGGSDRAYIMRVCADARDEGAPKDAVGRLYSFGDEWKRRGDVTTNYGHHLDSYARALTQYEKELKAERRASGRST
jgi:hypothetical protein